MKFKLGKPKPVELRPIEDIEEEAREVEITIYPIRTSKGKWGYEFTYNGTLYKRESYESSRYYNERKLPFSSEGYALVKAKEHLADLVEQNKFANTPAFTHKVNLDDLP